MIEGTATSIDFSLPTHRAYLANIIATANLAMWLAVRNREIF